jgi:NADPH:quinone reductase-like Zn-dependent oxidoreductase
MGGANRLPRFKDYIDNKKLIIKVAKVFPLEEASVAHQLIEAGHTMGKYVLDCNKVK